MEGGILFGWLFVAIISGLFGINRKIGYGMTFLISLLFTPIVGVIAAYCTKSCNEYDMEQEKLKLLKEIRDKIVGIEKKTTSKVETDGEIKTAEGKIVKYGLKSEEVDNRIRFEVTYEDGMVGRLYSVPESLEYAYIAAGKYIHYEDKTSALVALYHYLNTYEVISKGRVK